MTTRTSENLSKGEKKSETMYVRVSYYVLLSSHFLPYYGEVSFQTEVHC